MSLSPTTNDNDNQTATDQTVKSIAKQAMPISTDDDRKEQDGGISPNKKKRRRIPRIPCCNATPVHPSKKRKIINYGDNTPMPAFNARRPRRKLFSPLKESPERRVRKNKSVRIKVGREWLDGVVMEVDDDEMVTIRYKAGKNPTNAKKFIMKEKRLPIDSKEFEMTNSRKSTLLFE